MKKERNSNFTESLSRRLMQLAGVFYERESNRQSLITVTACEVSPDSKNATILISVLPESHEQTAVEFMNRRRNDFRDYLKKNLKTKIIPYVTIEVDRGEKNRQLIDQLLKKE